MRAFLFSMTAQPAAILIRLAVAFVFLVAGLRKFADIEGGAGFFGSIGIPMPEVMFPFVAVMEVLCGLLILIGLVTRLAAIPIAIIMVVAIITTKLPCLPEGVSDALNSSRLDVAMLLCAIYLIWVGAGRWSADAQIAPRQTSV
ncbi:MAG: DoxX family protein [Bacteroidota bacterium]